MKKLVSSLIAVCAIGVLSNCTTIPLTSIPKLAGLNPHTFDFSQAKVAVRIQDGFKIEDGDVKLTVDLFDGTKHERTTETFDMLVEDMPASPFLLKDRRMGTSIYGFSFKQSDMARVLAFRDTFSQIAERGAANKERAENSFSLSVTSQGCLEEGANPFEKMKVKIYLKPAAEDDYFTFVKEQKIDLAALNEGKIPSCKAS
ncbi:hypothetical protein [Hirschia litorea]|uniref:Lipoprotein n=1 Tax=Hirschia litorea TaxID=1199156 RepID=A0ABW2IJV8_9PROT